LENLAASLEERRQVRLVHLLNNPSSPIPLPNARPPSKTHVHRSRIQVDPQLHRLLAQH
jgi:hypothetical protein